MKPAAFKYYAAQNLEEVHHILAQYGDEVTLLAGGQSLVPTLNFRLAQPAVLVDLNRVRELAEIRPGEGKLAIGAMVRQRRLEKDPVIAGNSPLLAACMPHIAHYQIRTRGTLGGSLAHADPSAELPAVVSVLSGRLKLTSSSRERWLSCDEFFQGMFQTARQPQEVLTEIELPALPEGSGWGFLEVVRRHGDYALMGVAAVVPVDEEGRVTGPRLSYLSAGDGVVRGAHAEASLEGNVLSESLIEGAARLASESDVEPLEDVHATVAFRRHLARVLTRRVLLQSWLRVATTLREESSS